MEFDYKLYKEMRFKMFFQTLEWMVPFVKSPRKFSFSSCWTWKRTWLDVGKIVATRYRHRFFDQVGHACMHLVEISKFSLNNVTIRLTKILNNLLEHPKFWFSKSFFSVESSPKQDFWSTLFSKNVSNFCRLSA